MLISINQEILYLKEKLREYNKLKSLKEAKLQELEKKKTQNKELKRILEKERKDVYKLEGLSVSTIFSTLMGNKYEKLDKEKEEYLLAKLKYEDSLDHIDKLEDEVSHLTESLSDYGNIEDKYRRLINEKEKLIIEEGGNLGLRLKNSIGKMDEIQMDIKEIKEAIDAGETSLKALAEVRGKLKDAQSWGVWDILGGGLISNIGKHSAIEDANKLAEEVQYHLKSFKKELADVNEFTDMKVNLSSFSSFADFFLDGILVDWFVQTKINDSLDNVNKTIEKIEEIINDLKGSLANLEASFKKEEAESNKILSL